MLCADEVGGGEHKGFSYSQWDYTHIKGGMSYYFQKYDVVNALPHFCLARCLSLSQAS